MNSEIEEELRNELEAYKKDKERVREILGSIGGVKDQRRELLINIFLLILAVGIAMASLTFHFIPSAIAIEVGVLIVTFKVVLLVNSVMKANHFMFWILSSIEFRVNAIDKKVTALKKSVVFPDDNGS